MGRMKGSAQGRIITSVSISPEFYKLCYEHHISFSEAMRVGISIILAERGISDYDNNLNLYRKMNLFRQKAEESLSKIYELEEQLKKREDFNRK